MLAYFGLVTYYHNSMSTASLHRSYLGNSLDTRNLLYATCKLQKLQKAKPARVPKRQEHRKRLDRETRGRGRGGKRKTEQEAGVWVPAVARGGHNAASPPPSGPPPPHSPHPPALPPLPIFPTPALAPAAAAPLRRRALRCGRRPVGADPVARAAATLFSVLPLPPQCLELPPQRQAPAPGALLGAHPLRWRRRTEDRRRGVPGRGQGATDWARG